MKERDIEKRVCEYARARGCEAEQVGGTEERVMHQCPFCGRDCDCSGDLEDHDTGEEYLEDCQCNCEAHREASGCEFDEDGVAY